VIPEFYLTCSSLLVVAPTLQWAGLAEQLVASSHPTDRLLPEKWESVPSLAQVQAACAFLSVTANGDQGRVVVLAQADRLLKEAANALLKSLEEPPQSARIILFAEREQLLPTVRSRVQVWRVAGSANAGWQKVGASYDLAQPADRELLKATLQLAPSVHAGIRNDTLDLLRRP